MNRDNSPTTLRVAYLELRQPPATVAPRPRQEQVRIERLDVAGYLALYRAVGESLKWDQRTRMTAADLEALLNSPSLRIHVLRDADGRALGFCEFDRSSFPEVEMKNFGLIPAAYGRGLGSWLLATALHVEWESGPARIWLHTDSWDHPSAVPVYEQAGFKVYAVRDQPADGL